jgi:hypothetical protein
MKDISMGLWRREDMMEGGGAEDTQVQEVGQRADLIAPMRRRRGQRRWFIETEKLEWGNRWGNTVFGFDK